MPASTTVIVAAYGDASEAPAPMIPVTVPVTGWMERPGGSPAADQVSTSPSGSTAHIGAFTTSPSPEARSPGSSMIGARFTFPTVHENDTCDDSTGTPSSVAVTVIAYGDDAAASYDTAPETNPVPGSIDSPAGNPAADHNNASPSGSDPATTSETTSPSAED